MKTGTIHQEVIFNTTPAVIYEMLMNGEQHAEFTGAPVVMSREIPGTFSVFDGYCTGYNMELAEGSKIVQAWRFDEDGWPEDHYSICTFLLEPLGEQCKLTFTQTEVPEHKVKDLEEGWNTYYWSAMKEAIDS